MMEAEHGQKEKTEMVDVTKTEVCRPDDLIDKRVKWQSAAEDELKTLNLRGERNQAVVNR